MGAVLRIRNPGTTITLTPSSGVTRRLADVDTAKANGSINVPEFAIGKPFWNLIVVGESTNGYGIPPTVTISGTTLSWTWGSIVAGYRQPATITYGIYS